MVSQFVMTGLGPAIHQKKKHFFKEMDARVKPAHDDGEVQRSAHDT